MASEFIEKYVKTEFWKIKFADRWNEACEPLQKVDWIPKGGDGKKLVIRR